MLEEELEQLFRFLRPGSRTILYCPEEVATTVEFARRGYRLLLVHPGESFRQECRQQLRGQGLSSLLMGGQEPGSREQWNLAREFYDLVVFCCSPPNGLALEELSPFLTPGATVVCQEKSVTEVGHAFELVRALPGGTAFYRKV